MFRYIDMPKLVAFYLKEFSVQKDGEPSVMYKFIFCLCLPFVSYAFRRARLIALAIAECTNSQDQIQRVLEKITGATIDVIPFSAEYYAAYDGSDDIPQFPYNNSQGMDNALVPYTPVANAGTFYITLNGASRTEVEGYLPLLIPFYIKTNIIFTNGQADVVTENNSPVTNQDGINVITFT